ncbi:hypothetical protein IE53DRAFT_367370 [Violaceomyces palustris]|uniref:Uncharacterized protein n=1 Tax=Violaceomyces palustris TaxID=1673888 RepID=A0ACD0P2H1_9BASI|nr:hypothetical protein IE53DRAFT_367370 [Violaceomyces palustris]
MAQASTSRQQASTASYQRPQHIIPVPIPETNLLSIEYPGIISTEGDRKHPQDNDEEKYNSLERAISTFDPASLPPYTSSPHSALEYIAGIYDKHLNLIECRPGSFAFRRTKTLRVDDQDLDSIYRHPLLGEVVDTHNVVIKVTKRVWFKRRKVGGKAKDASAHLPVDADPMDLDQDPGLERALPDSADGQHEEEVLETRKEYKVDPVGVATKTLRFRAMADFAYRPQTHVEVPESLDRRRDEQGDVEMSSEGDESFPPTSLLLDKTLELHDIIARMDFKSMRNYKLEPELEEYEKEVEDPDTGLTVKKSQLRMIPPPFFSRSEVPFNYAFKQVSNTELRTVPRPKGVRFIPLQESLLSSTSSSSSSSHLQRYENRARIANVSPISWKVSDPKIPTRPPLDVVKRKSKIPNEVVGAVSSLFEQRPIWTRRALLNSLDDKIRDEINSTNGKLCIALLSFSAVGGPWRDTILRMGYDPRKNKEDRFYQRVFLRAVKGDGVGPVNARRVVARTLKKVGADAFGDSSFLTENLVEGGENEEGDGTTSNVTRPRANTTGGEAPASSHDRESHIFDGCTLTKNAGNFQLCDVTDPYILPYIKRVNDEDLADGVERIGTRWLREDCDPVSGWYTSRAMDLIRNLMSVRFHGLMEKEEKESDESLDEVVRIAKSKWRQEDAGSAAAAVDDGDSSSLEGGDGEEREREDREDDARAMQRETLEEIRSGISGGRSKARSNATKERHGLAVPQRATELVERLSGNAGRGSSKAKERRKSKGSRMGNWSDSLRVSASSVGGIKGFLQESESLKDYSPRRLGSFSLKKLKNPLSSDLSKANLAKNDSFQRMSSRKGYEELERDQHLMIDQSYIDALKHMSLSTIYKSALEGKRTGKGFELNGKVFGGVEEPTLVRKDGRKVIQFRFPQTRAPFGLASATVTFQAQGQCSSKFGGDQMEESQRSCCRGRSSSSLIDQAFSENLKGRNPLDDYRNVLLSKPGDRFRLNGREVTGAGVELAERDSKGVEGLRYRFRLKGAANVVTAASWNARTA